jgi:Lipid A 3-O-deacylase (PagL)
VERSTTLAWLVLVLLMSAGPLSPGTVHAAEPTTAKSDTPFAQGTEDFELSASYATHIRFSQAHVYNVTGEFSKYLFDNLSLGGEVQGYYAEQPDNPDVIIGGLGLLGRWHFFNHDDWSIYFDGGGGVTFADDEFPTYPYPGTHFNFTGKFGFGTTYRLHPNEFLTAGIRYFHLSNGRIHGPDQNPTYDSIQVYAGMMWTR